MPFANKTKHTHINSFSKPSEWHMLQTVRPHETNTEQQCWSDIRLLARLNLFHYSWTSLVNWQSNRFSHSGTLQVFRLTTCCCCASRWLDSHSADFLSTLFFNSAQKSVSKLVCTKYKFKQSYAWTRRSLLIMFLPRFIMI